MKLNVYVGENKEYKIEYDLFDNEIVRMIFKRLQDTTKVLSNTECYGFRTVEEIKSDLDSIVIELRAAGMDITGDVAGLNELHINFPSYHAQNSGNEAIQEILRRFNYKIHELETAERKSFRGYLMTGWDEGVSIPLTGYEMFELPQSNRLYMNYPHVGKHFLELFLDNDVDCPEEQIVLTNRIQASIVQFFTKQDYTFEEAAPQLLQFYKKVAHKMPYLFGDPRLAIGYMPLGEMINERPEVEAAIAQYKYIHSWECLTESA